MEMRTITACAMTAEAIRKFLEAVKARRIKAALVNGRTVYAVSTLIVNRQEMADTGYTPALIVLATGGKWHKLPLAHVMSGNRDIGCSWLEKYTKKPYATEREAVKAAAEFANKIMPEGARLCEATAQKYAAIIAEEEAAKKAAEAATPEAKEAAKAEREEAAKAEKAERNEAKFARAVKEATRTAKAVNGNSDEAAIYALLDAIAGISQIGQAIAGYARPLVAEAYAELKKAMSTAAATAERAAREAAMSKIHKAEAAAREASAKEAASKAAAVAAECKASAAKKAEREANAAAAAAKRTAAAAKAAADKAEARIEAAKANGAK